MTSTPLLDWHPPDGNRDGRTFDPDRDGVRLNRQAQLVWECLQEGHWWTLGAIAERTGQPEASVSARIRDLRKPRFGGRTIEREYVSDGLWRYRWTRG